MVTGGPLSPLTASRSAASHFEAVSVSGARAAALALGGSRNDLLVAASAVGLGRYHERSGIDLPGAAHRDADDPPPRGRAGRQLVRTSPACRCPRPAGTRAALRRGRRPPGPGAPRAGRRSRRRRSPAPSTVCPTGCCSARCTVRPRRSTSWPRRARPPRSAPDLRGEVVGSYPFGPRLGCLMNIAAFGNDDRLDVGIALDATAIAEPDFLLEAFRTAFARYVPALRASAPVPVAASEPLRRTRTVGCARCVRPALTPGARPRRRRISPERAGRPSA